LPPLGPLLPLLGPPLVPLLGLPLLDLLRGLLLLALVLLPLLGLPLHGLPGAPLLPLLLGLLLLLPVAACARRQAGRLAGAVPPEALGPVRVAAPAAAARHARPLGICGGGAAERRPPPQ
jgi:hypothetical protein